MVSSDDRGTVLADRLFEAAVPFPVQRKHLDTVQNNNRRHLKLYLRSLIADRAHSLFLYKDSRFRA